MVTLDTVFCARHKGFIPGEFVQLTISDNGCGMDKEILNSIFEPFFTTKAVDKGTGLGLSTVYGIAKQNNGFIDVYSEPGKGTSVKIYLPRYDNKAVEIQEGDTENTPQGQGETILLVEDDSQVLKLVQKFLNELGYSVLALGAPKEAIRLVKKQKTKIHLLITDVIMPEMNGRELSERLKSFNSDLKCIFMSGYAADAIGHHGVLLKGEHFIQKPFSKENLAKIVRKVLIEK
jgi:CheY-like chemotaxis protein